MYLECECDSVEKTYTLLIRPSKLMQHYDTIKQVDKYRQDILMA